MSISRVSGSARLMEARQTGNGRVRWSSGRLAGLDRLRGVAIVCMVVDHVCAWALHVAEVGGGAATGLWVLRLTVGRVALPLFMVVSGWLWAYRPARTERLIDVALVAAVTSWAIWITDAGIALPEILTVWLIAALFLKGCDGHRAGWALLIGAVCVVGIAIEPEFGWSGYDLRLVLLLLVLGILARRPPELFDLDGIGRRLLPAGFEPVGRAPLVWYGAHVLVLCAAAAAWRAWS